MKKYFARILVVGIVLSLFSSVGTLPTYAQVGPNDRCNGDEVAESPLRFEPGFIPLICDPGLRCFSGACIQPAPAAQLNCACVQDGVAGSGNNGFKCTRDTDPNAIRNSNAPIIYCSTSDKGCFTDLSANLPTDPITINRTDQDHYANDTLRGVTCGPVQEEATCTCLGTGTGGEGADANNFECKLVSDQNITGTATCDSGQKCIQVPAGPDQGVNNIAKNQRGEVFTRPGGVNMKGIKCENPEVVERLRAPLPPPPPPPPCKTVVAGICTEFNTAVGVLGTAPEDFITRLFAVLLSVSGGIALLLIMKAGYQMMTSQGKPEQLQGGRDQLVAAIVGLVFLIFSFVILQIIGFDLLRIPGFGGEGGGGGAGGGGIGTAPRGALCTNDNQCVSGSCGTAPAGPGGNSGQCQ